MFSAMNCPLDASSGAAISIRTFLEHFARHGVDVQSFSAGVYDRPPFATPTESIRSTGALPVAEPGHPQNLWICEKGGVRHNIVLTASMNYKQLKRDEYQRVFTRALEFIRNYEPDVLLLYGGSPYERSLLKYAREHNIATVFYLVNPGYRDITNFQHVDMFVTDSAATRDLFKERFGIALEVVGKFVEQPVVPPGADTREFVTFINPTPEKGLTLFYRIVELAAEVLPEARFLVVESRGHLATAESEMGMHFGQFGNLTRVGLQRDMGAVFGATRILLVPSLWHDSGPRVSVEALSLGIPAIVSDRGGLPELVGDAGIVIPPPAPLVTNHRLIPPLSQAIPWVEAIRLLTSDDQLYEQFRTRARAQWEAHDPDLRLPGIIEKIETLVASKKTDAAS
ncbi:MAG TPA: glycosyltransferase [Devosiaceae bacterium]